MPGIKELKTRIRSIQSTRKITRAMQMVSAAKMRKAQAATLASRTYSSLAWELIMNLAAHLQSTNRLLRTYPLSKKVGVIMLSTNRGFVGGLNTNLIAKLKEIDSLTKISNENSASPEVITEIVTYGKYAKTITVRLNKKILADFPKIDKTISTEDIYPLVQLITKAYLTGQYKKIVILYNHYVSTLVQRPTVKQVLPFTEFTDFHTLVKKPVPSGDEKYFVPPPDLDEELSDVTDISESAYLFEPTPQLVLDHLLPRIIESQVYQAILESDASEHSARMVMMKNATEAAGDLINDLTLTYNQIRQNKITTELAEITAGRIALE